MWTRNWGCYCFCWKRRL